MKRILGIIALLISFGAWAQNDVVPNRPSPPKLVNDFTGKLLTQDQVLALEQKLDTYNDSTSNQVAIVVVESLEGYSPEDYAIAVGTKWGVGNKDFNNGVVILVSTGGGQGNRKVAIVTGYGLEGAIPDLTTKAIIDNDVIPNFKEGNYYRGLDAAIDDIIKAAAGRYTAPAGYGKGKGKAAPVIFIILIIFFILLSAFMRNNRGGGGMLSGGTGWIIGSMLGSGSRGWGGGGSSSGGGGGFGGFGGGGFGGGGSSGSW